MSSLGAIDSAPKTKPWSSSSAPSTTPRLSSHTKAIRPDCQVVERSTGGGSTAGMAKDVATMLRLVEALVRDEEGRDGKWGGEVDADDGDER